MSTGAVLLVQLSERPCNTAINRWRRDFLNAFDPDEYDFYEVGPLRLIPRDDPAEICLPGSGVWLDAAVCLAFSDLGFYRRGDGQNVTLMAEWLEAHIPNCKVWYGHDAADESLRPFQVE